MLSKRGITMNAIYARVSTDEQARSGYSLQDQIDQCRKKLLSMGLSNIKEYIDDGYSGEFLDRPALSRLREDLRAKLIQTVIVYDPDRLSRNLTNQLIIADEIEKYGAKLEFITGSYDASPEGRLFFSMRGAIAEFEKEKIRERSLRGKKAKVMSGKPLFGKEKYGYHCDRQTGQYVINEAEAEIVRLIFKKYLENMAGVATLYEQLKAMGIVNRAGKPFSISVLHRILSEEMYAGTKWAFQKVSKNIGQKKRKVVTRNKSEWISIEVPAIIDRETFEKTTALRRQNKAVARRNTKFGYLLSGIIKCAKCGYAMNGVRFPKRNNKEYAYYVCTAYVNGKECANRRCVPSVELDEAVWRDIAAMFRKSGGIKKIGRANNKGKTKAAAEERLKKLKARQSAVAKWIADGTIELSIIEKELQKINAEISAAQAAIAATVQPNAKASDVKPEEVISANTFEEKRRILLRLGITVTAERTENGETLYKIRV
ncbi:MAG: recombinase family protein [Negativicutes bacterium]|nr:recombinase family protein [Negativicutes bacterium]